MDCYNTFMKKVTRLFESFAPTNYQLKLELVPEKKRFSGTVTIKGRKTGRPSKRLTFHQKDLKITGASAVRHDKKGDEAISFDRVNTHKAYDELRLHSNKMLFPGEYTITIEFSGRITDPMNGLYPCYFKQDGAEKMLFATQFESHHAREVFPCIDEPEAKATFDLTLVTPDEKNTVIANTPVARQKEVSDSRVETTFEQTPIMSTYLLAFAYGDIDYQEAKTKRGTVVRTYATPNNVKFTDFALDIAVKVLDFYEDYFGIPYPLAKCDMIALPDFASGAMENWGLITYREQTLLVDPKNTSLTTKQYVAMVVAHELAHQWFGNLVTMRWWTDLWLNEGFASWIEYLAVDHLYPDWDMWTQFVANEQQSALKLDALDNTHPVEVPINHPDEIRSIFDAISYNKGASVIHMLHGYLGEVDFRDGLRHYLKEHAYKNTTTDDLWSALEKVSGKPVKAFMHAWTSLPGFPLLSVDEHKGEIHLHQERFYMQRPEKVNGELWPVPLLAPGAPEQCNEQSFRYTSTSFQKLNQGQSGFYRTAYSPVLLDALTEMVPSLEPLDRLGLLADTFDAAKAGYASTEGAIHLLKKYDKEDNAAVWDIIALNIGELRRVMDDDELREQLKPLIISLTAKQIQRLGFEEKSTDSHFDKLLRPTVLGLAASADEPAVLKWCFDTFASIDSPEEVHADLRSVVFNTSARHGDIKTFNKLLAWHNGTENSEERVTLSAALTSFKQPKMIDQALALIPTNDVRRQDAMYWLAYSFMNRYAKHAAWDWMRDNWGWLEKQLGSDLSFYRTPIYAGRSFSDESFVKEYDAFFADKLTPALERSIKQGREMLEWQAAWKDRDLAELLNFFSGKDE